MARKNLFADDDDDDKLKEANDRDVAKTKERAEGGRSDDFIDPAESKGEAEGVTEVDLEEVEENEQRAKEGATEEGRSRADRRRDRYAEMAEEKKAASERAEKLERDLADERTRRIALETVAPQRQQQPEADPEGQEILRIRGERKHLHTAFLAKQQAGGMTEAERDDFERKGYELQDRENFATHQRNVRLTGGNRGGMTQEQVRAEAQLEVIRSTYPDIYGHPNKLVAEHTASTYRALRATGLPPTKETLERAVGETRKAFRLPGATPRRPPPDEAARRRLSGAGSGGPRGGGEAPVVVRMTKDQRRMADAAYSHLPTEKARHEAWAKGPGRKLLAKGITS